MSKITIIETSLDAPQVTNGILQRLSKSDSVFAKWAKDLDIVPLIRGCAKNALELLSTIDGIRLGTHVEDYYGNRTDNHNGHKFIGVLRSDKLPGGLGVYMEDNGEIKFAADDYESEWGVEIERLQKAFENAFIAEAGRTFMKFKKYQVKIVPEILNGSIVFTVQGLKAGGV
jgi:hypothetical protein